MLQEVQAQAMELASAPHLDAAAAGESPTSGGSRRAAGVDAASTQVTTTGKQRDRQEQACPPPEEVAEEEAAIQGTLPRLGGDVQQPSEVQLQAKIGDEALASAPQGGSGVQHAVSYASGAFGSCLFSPPPTAPPPPPSQHGVEAAAPRHCSAMQQTQIAAWPAGLSGSLDLAGAQESAGQLALDAGQALGGVADAGGRSLRQEDEVMDLSGEDDAPAAEGAEGQEEGDEAMDKDLTEEDGLDNGEEQEGQEEQRRPMEGTEDREGCGGENDGHRSHQQPHEGRSALLDLNQLAGLAAAVAEPKLMDASFSEGSQQPQILAA